MNAAPVLVWKHGTTADAAREVIRGELDKLGVSGRVAWDGNKAAASVGWGMVLKAEGEVTADAVTLDTCGGALGGTVLGMCREVFGRVFPEGGPA